MDRRGWTVFLILLLAGAFAAVFAVTKTVKAQGAQCGPLEGMLDKLQNEYRETVAWEGVMENGVQVILFQSPGGSWTIIAVHGVAGCILALGRDGTGAVISGEET